MPEVRQVRVRIAGQPFALSAADVERVAVDLAPEPIDVHYVVVAGRKFPPKQIVAAVTGFDRADFITHQARSILRRLGFDTGRQDARGLLPPPPLRPLTADERRRVDLLVPHRGRYVALDLDGEVLASAVDPNDVMRWLRDHSRRADGGIFRVPTDPTADQGFTATGL